MSAANRNEIEQHRAAYETADEVLQWIRQWAITGCDQVMVVKAKQVRDYLGAHPIGSDYFDEVKS